MNPLAKRLIAFFVHTLLFLTIGFYAGKQSVRLYDFLRYQMVHSTKEGNLYLCPVQGETINEFLDDKEFHPTENCERLPGCPVCGIGGWRKLGPK